MEPTFNVAAALVPTNAILPPLANVARAEISSTEAVPPPIEMLPEVPSALVFVVDTINVPPVTLVPPEYVLLLAVGFNVTEPLVTFNVEPVIWPVNVKAVPLMTVDAPVNEIALASEIVADDNAPVPLKLMVLALLNEATLFNDNVPPEIVIAPVVPIAVLKLGASMPPVISVLPE